MVHPGLSAVPEHRHTIFEICMVFLTAGFARETAEKRLNLKSLRDRRRLMNLRPWIPSASAFVYPLRLFKSSRFVGKLVENSGTDARGCTCTRARTLFIKKRQRTRASCAPQRLACWP
jgi:hypothetical protein